MTEKTGTCVQEWRGLRQGKPCWGEIEVVDHGPEFGPSLACQGHRRGVAEDTRAYDPEPKAIEGPRAAQVQECDGTARPGEPCWGEVRDARQDGPSRTYRACIGHYLAVAEQRSHYSPAPPGGAAAFAAVMGAPLDPGRFGGLRDEKAPWADRPKKERGARVEVRKTFHSAELGTIAGCLVVRGTLRRADPVYIRRGNTVYPLPFTIRELRRFKDDVAEVPEEHECGLRLDGFELEEGDILETNPRAGGHPPEIVPIKERLGGKKVGEAHMRSDGHIDIVLDDSPAGRRVRGMVRDTPHVSILDDPPACFVVELSNAGPITLERDGINPSTAGAAQIGHFLGRLVESWRKAGGPPIRIEADLGDVRVPPAAWAQPPGVEGEPNPTPLLLRVSALEVEAGGFDERLRAEGEANLLLERRIDSLAQSLGSFILDQAEDGGSTLVSPEAHAVGLKASAQVRVRAGERDRAVAENRRLREANRQRSDEILALERGVADLRNECRTSRKFGADLSKESARRLDLLRRAYEELHPEAGDIRVLQALRADVRREFEEVAKLPCPHVGDSDAEPFCEDGRPCFSLNSPEAKAKRREDWTDAAIATATNVANEANRLRSELSVEKKKVERYDKVCRTNARLRGLLSRSEVHLSDAEPKGPTEKRRKLQADIRTELEGKGPR